MLASTVQFSTYDQSPSTRPRQTPTTPRGAGRYEMQKNPDGDRRPGFPDARSLRTQQRAYEPTLTRHHVPHPEGSY
jgi:hypothetical protein